MHEATRDAGVLEATGPLWGLALGSGKTPYRTQVALADLADQVIPAGRQVCDRVRPVRAAGRLLGQLGLPTVVVQEGGYDLDALGELVCETLTGLEEGLRA